MWRSHRRIRQSTSGLCTRDGSGQTVANESPKSSSANGFAPGNSRGNLLLAAFNRRVPASPGTNVAALQVREVGKFTGCSRFPQLLEGDIDRSYVVASVLAMMSTHLQRIWSIGP